MRLHLMPADQGRVCDPVMQWVVRTGHAAGFDVHAVDHPATGSGADDALLQDAVQAARDGAVLAGVSRGARIAVRAAQQVPVRGLLLLSFPFHPRGQPARTERATWFDTLDAPVLLVQGTRDAMGNRERVRGYRLPPSVQVHWVASANHSLHPRPKAGLSRDVLWDEAALAIQGWLQRLSCP